MTELDFEELDRAVNDLMTNVDTSKRREGADDPADNVLVLDSPAPTVSAPATQATIASQPEVVEPAPTPAGEVSTTPTAPLAVKRRGQFMDIMHPSADMRTAPKPVSRQAMSVQPPASMIEPPSDPMTPTEPEVNITPTIEAATSSEPEESQAPSQPEWPDPIDMAMSESQQSPQADTQAEVETADGNDQPREPEPLTSPFLPDAKVEKRPLGSAVTQSQPVGVDDESPLQDGQASAAVETGDEEAADTETPVVTEPSHDDTQTPVDATTLPDEFHHDVLSVESSDVMSQAVPAPVSSDHDTNPETEVPAGGSITQQYTESPSTGDQTSGAIYDTASYHQSVEAAKPQKKTSPLKIIIWVLVLLIIGAAAGATYFFVTRQ